MDEKLKNDNKKVMLVQDAKDGKVKGVTGVDKEGNAQTTPDGVSENNISNLMNVNTQDSVLEAFFKKFMQEAENPSHTGIFVMVESALNKLIKIDLDPQELEKHRIDPAAELQNLQGQNPKQQQGGGDATSQSFQPMDTSKIDRADLERKGIKWDAIEPHLNAMAYGYKSNKLIEMNPEMEPGGVRVPTKGRTSLEEQSDGSIKVMPHYWQEKPNLEAPLHNTLLDKEAKENLEQTGHAGKIVDLELTPGKKEPCYVSLDPLTNRLEVMPVSQLGQIASLKGRELSQGQQLDFAAGRRITVEKMVSRSGTFFDGHVQVDAANRNFKFSYDGLDRNRYAQENKAIRSQQKEQQKAEGKDTASEDGLKKLHIPNKILKADVPENALKNWNAANNDPSKRADVKAFYIKGMVKDGQDQPFNAWVRPNWEKGKMDFFKYNPKYAKKQGAEVTPANESKTQVAVNSEGKTNEATKNVKEPLKQGQQTPNGNQRKKQDEQRQRQTPPARRQSPPKAGVKQSSPKL